MDESGRLFAALAQRGAGRAEALRLIADINLERYEQNGAKRSPAQGAGAGAGAGAAPGLAPELAAVEARVGFEQAAAAGSEEAAFKLAYLLQHGIGGTRQLSRAKQLFQRVRDSGGKSALPAAIALFGLRVCTVLPCPQGWGPSTEPLALHEST